MPSMSAAPPDAGFPQTRIVESPVLELLTSLEALVAPIRFGEFRTAVTHTLGTAFLDEVRSVNGQFQGGNAFVEFAVETALSEDVATFIDRVISMTPRHFAFVALGRLYPEDELPEPLTTASVTAFLDARGTRGSSQHAGADFSWVDDIPSVQRRVGDLWSRYWREFFQAWYEETRTVRRGAVDAMTRQLEVRGAPDLYRSVCGMRDLPAPLPADQPYHTIIYSPILMYQEVSRFFYGYGIIVVPYDATETDERQREQARRRDELSRVFRALSDPGRLRMLELIAGSDYSFNGQKVAWRMNLSTSVVSRHLKQLRDAGLLEDYSPDNRNTVYRVRIDALSRVSEDLIRYVKRE